MIVYPQVGDVGFDIVLVISRQGAPVNISGATDIEVVLRAPDGRYKTFAAGFKTNGTDGKVLYTTQAADDLDMEGSWEAQVKLTLGSFVGRSAVAVMPVRKNADR